MLEKTLESPLDCKEIQLVHPKENQSRIFIGRTDADAETPIIWPPHVKNWLLGKDPDAGKDWRQEEKGTTEDEMAGWHHWVDGCESEWTPGVGDGQGGLACCDSWGRKESDMTEWLIWSDLIWFIVNFYQCELCGRCLCIEAAGVGWSVALMGASSTQREVWMINGFNEGKKTSNKQLCTSRNRHRRTKSS